MNKIGIIGDIHVGQTFYHNQVITDYHNKKRDELFDEIIARFKKDGVDTILFSGDIFDNRNIVTVESLHYVIDLFSNRMKDFKIITITGNHDMQYENSDCLTSLEFLHFIPNVTVIDKEPVAMQFGQYTWHLFPWLGTPANKEKALEYMKSVGCTPEKRAANVFFGHFDIIGMLMEAGNISVAGFDPNEMSKYCTYVISGHYHCKSAKKIGNTRFLYLGTPYHLSFAHLGVDPGYYICNTDTMKIDFIENKIGERYIEVNDYDDIDAMPDLSGTLVKYNNDVSKTSEEAMVPLDKLKAKNPLHVFPSPYGKHVEERDAADAVAIIAEDDEEAKKVVTMSQMEVARLFMDNADQPPPTLSDGTSSKDKIISMIASFDAM